MMLRMSLGESILLYRKRLQMTAISLALELDVSRNTIRNWETNKTQPSAEQLYKISKIFGVSLEELIAGQKPEPITVIICNRDKELKRIVLD